MIDMTNNNVYFLLTFLKNLALSIEYQESSFKHLREWILEVLKLTVDKMLEVSIEEFEES